MKEIDEKLKTAFAFHKSGDFQSAEMLYKEILADDPQNVNALNLFGILLHHLKRYDDAIACIGRAVKIQPTSYFYENLGIAYRDSENFEKAVECYLKVLEFEPENAQIYIEIGSIYRTLKNIGGAVYYYKKALDLNPDLPEVYNNLGNALAFKRDTYEAIRLFNKALELKPDFIEVYNNLGMAFYDINEYDKAIEAFEKVLTVNPDIAETYNNIGTALSCKLEHEKALEAFKKALELKPDFPTARYNISTEHLLVKNFEEGWPDYEYRFNFREEFIKLPKPLWKGECLEGKTIFVHYEQGFGDSIQFARFIPVLHNLGAKVIFKPHKGLEDLFRGSDLKAEIIDSSVPNDGFDYDCYIHLVSLPGLLGANESTIPYKDGYLKADPERVRLYKEEFFNNSKFKIGIKWLGNAKGDPRRIIPLEYFYRFAQLDNVEVYSLQKGIGMEELNRLPENVRITDIGRTFTDFSSTAAAIANLDLVISNDTSLAHLSGALAKPTWILLAATPEWRWGINDETSYWYDSVRLFRQKEIGNWEYPAHQAFEALMALLD